MRGARIMFASFVALPGLLLFELTALSGAPGLVEDDFFNMILRISIGVLLLAFARRSIVMLTREHPTSSP